MDPEAEAALQDLKKYLSSTPVLVVPKPQEPLLLYLAATNQVVSAALVAQREADEVAAATVELADGGSGRKWRGSAQWFGEAGILPRPHQRPPGRYPR